MIVSFTLFLSFNDIDRLLHHVRNLSQKGLHHRWHSSEIKNRDLPIFDHQKGNGLHTYPSSSCATTSARGLDLFCSSACSNAQRDFRDRQDSEFPRFNSFSDDGLCLCHGFKPI